MATPLTYRSGIPVVFFGIGLLFVSVGLRSGDWLGLFLGIMGSVGLFTGYLAYTSDRPIAYDQQGIYLPGRQLGGEQLCIPWSAIRELRFVKVIDHEGDSDALLLGLRSAADHPIHDLKLYRRELSKVVRDLPLPEVPFLLSSESWRMKPGDAEQVLLAAWKAHAT